MRLSTVFSIFFDFFLRIFFAPPATPGGNAPHPCFAAGVLWPQAFFWANFMRIWLPSSGTPGVRRFPGLGGDGFRNAGCVHLTGKGAVFLAEK